MYQARRILNINLVNLWCRSLLVFIPSLSLVSSIVSPDSGIDPASPCRASALVSGVDGYPYIHLGQQDDVNAIPNCTTFEGELYLNVTIPGDVELPELVSINGSIGMLQFANPDYFLPHTLTGLSAPKLKTVLHQKNDSTFIRAVNVTSLKKIKPSSLEIFAGTFELLDLPSLRELSLITLSSPHAVGLFVTHTNLSNIRFLFTKSSHFTTLKIIANDELTGAIITFQTPDPQKTLLSGDITVSGNSKLKSLHIEGGDNGDWRYSYGSSVEPSGDAFEQFSVAGLRVINSSALDILRLRGLVTLPGSTSSFYIEDCGVLRNVSAPQLSSIEDDFLITGCPQLSRVILPALTTIGGNFNISNSSSSSTDLQFPHLETVSGKVFLDGAFPNFDLPLLDHAFRGFVVNSTASNFTCSKFDKLFSQGYIRDPYTCRAPQTSNNTIPVIPTNSTPPTNSTEPGDKSSSSLSLGAKAEIGAGLGVAAVIVLGLLLWWFCFKRKEPKSEEGKQGDITVGDDMAEMLQGKHHDMTEVHADSKPSELQADGTGKGLQYAIARKPITQNTQEDGVGESTVQRHELQ